MRLTKAQESREVLKRFLDFYHAITTSEAVPESFANFVADDEAKTAIRFLDRIHGGPDRKIKAMIEAATCPSEEEFTVILASAGDKKIEVIKELRAITGLGLKEAKDLIEGAPTIVKDRLSKVEAAKIRAQLEHVGAKTELTIYGP
jgi:ribosomal protein L7/L12